MKYTHKFKILFFANSGLLLISGLLTFVFQNYFLINTDFGYDKNPLFICFLKTHGVSSIIVFLMIGYLIPTHIKPGLRKKKRLLSGLSLLTIVSLLMFSVPFLYYLNLESLKEIVSTIHWYLGLIMIPVFLWHWIEKSQAPSQ